MDSEFTFSGNIIRVVPFFFLSPSHNTSHSKAVLQLSVEKGGEGDVGGEKKAKKSKSLQVTEERADAKDSDPHESERGKRVGGTAWEGER